MNWNTRRKFRKLHRWGAFLTALPFLIVLITGLILQVKKEFSWIQPPTQQGSISNQTPGLSFQRILELASTVPDAEISEWEDVDRLDVRPDNGVVKVRTRNGWELQFDLGTGQLLHSQQRNSDWIESLHDGSWFHDKAKLWIFLPSAGIVGTLWLTGIYLLCVPYFAKWQNRRRISARKRERRPNKREEFQTELSEH